jgi:hypothetical protein
MGEVFKGLGQPPFARLGQHHALERVFGQGAQHLPVQAVGVGGIVQAHIAHANTGPAQPLGELAHGGEDKHKLLLMMAHIGGFVHHLGHQHNVALAIEVAKRGQPLAELIAQDQPE